MAASYFPPGPPPELRARVEAVEAYLAEHHLASVTWHFTLNNHASTRPKANGGPLVRAVTPCKTFTHVAPGSAVGAAVGAGSWRCSLDLPNSFTPTDGRRLQTEGYGSTKTEASEHACRRAVAHLLMTEPSQVILRPAHWRIPPSALLEGLPGTETVHQALPVHVPARSLEAGVEAATLTAAEVDYQVADLLRRCLNAHGGSFDPSRISRAALGQGPGEERIYSQFNKLLLPGGLRPFVERHPEFSWTSRDPKGMLITWALDAAPSSASASGPEQPTAPPTWTVPHRPQSAVGDHGGYSSSSPAASSSGPSISRLPWQSGQHPGLEALPVLEQHAGLQALAEAPRWPLAPVGYPSASAAASDAEDAPADDEDAPDDAPVRHHGAAADADAEDAPERPGSASASGLPEDMPWPPWAWLGAHPSDNRGSPR